MQPLDGDRMNASLVDRLVAQGALWSKNLIAAFRATPRHRFLDRVYLCHANRGWRELRFPSTPGPNDWKVIYSDRALITRLAKNTVDGLMMPISSSSQPSLMAQMLEDLDIRPDLRVLEVGSGTGYNAALMAFLAGGQGVVSVDVDRKVLADAERHLQAFPERKVQLVHADGRAKLPDQQPFDRIMVTASTPDLEPAWLEQASEGGLVVAPLALAPGLAFVVRGCVNKGRFSGKLTRAAYFMPLRSESEAGARSEETEPPSESAKSLKSAEPPWAQWGEIRRLRYVMSPLLQAFAFYGYLNGFTVRYQTGPSGQSVYRLLDRAARRECWVGIKQWFAFDASGFELGQKLWRQFLDGGAPRPTEFTLQMSGSESIKPTPGLESYVLAGPRFEHAWELVSHRERPIY